MVMTETMREALKKKLMLLGEETIEEYLGFPLDGMKHPKTLEDLINGKIDSDTELFPEELEAAYKRYCYIDCIKRELAELCWKAEELLGDAPSENDCTNAENDVIAELANLQNAIANLGIEAKRQCELKMPLSNGAALVAYCDYNVDYPGAGVQYEDKDGYQYDVVLAESDGPEDEYDRDKIRVYVYADPGQDDYTDRFEISRKELEEIAEAE